MAAQKWVAPQRQKLPDTQKEELENGLSPATQSPGVKRCN